MAAPEMKELEILTTEQIGLLGSLFSIVYACGRLLSGGLCDRKAPWKMISLGMALCGISNLCIGTFPPFPATALLWGINAFSQSLLWGSILRILSAIYSEEAAKKRASYMGTAVATGNLAGILLHSELISRFGAQWAFLFPGGVTLALGAVAVLSLHRIQPPEAVRKKASKKLDPGLRQMLLPAVIHGVMKDNISLWMTVYIMDCFAVDLQQSSGYVLLIPAVGMLGRLLAPSLYRLARGQERPLLLWGFAAAAAGSALLVLYAPSAWAAIGYLSLVYMAVSVINACFLAFFPIRYTARGQVATVSGILDFATYLGTGLSAMVFGRLITYAGYHAMFAVWAGLSCLAAGYLLWLKKKEIRAHG